MKGLIIQNTKKINKLPIRKIFTEEDWGKTEKKNYGLNLKNTAFKQNITIGLHNDAISIFSIRINISIIKIWEVDSFKF